MDKKIIFAVAGSGKTTHIVNGLSNNKHSLIVTYTIGNYENLRYKISKKFGGTWPENITLMTYFTFLYRFCYKPFLADMYNARGIIFKSNDDRYAKQSNLNYYMTPNRYIFSNRLSLLLEKSGVIDDIRSRIVKYFDEFIIDEVQDISGRDFTFLEELIDTKVNMLFVGDFFQHTFDTSRDGRVNGSLFDCKSAYEARFTRKGLIPDNTTLTSSWRCSRNVCDYVKNVLGIHISSHRSDTDNTSIEYVADAIKIDSILKDEQVIKLHYQNSAKFGVGHKNWGATKGEDHYYDVCVMLNKSTVAKYNDGKLHELPQPTKNKLYVAITRTRNNVYFINE